MLPINLPSNRTKLRLQILILLDILTTRNSHLNQQNLLLHMRVHLQEPVESFQFLRQPLYIIQAVNSEDYSYAFIPLFQLFGAFLDFGFCERVVEFLGVDSDDEGACFD